MRVLLLNSGVIRSPPRFGGGVERHTFYLANALADRGIDVHFVTGVSDFHQYDPRVRIQRLPPLDVPIQSRKFNRLVGEWLGGVLVQTAARKSLSETRFEIVHGNTGSALIFLTKRRKPLEAKTILTVHNPPPMSSQDGEGISQSIRRVTYRLVDTPTGRAVNHLITLSRSTAVELEAEYGIPSSKISVIPTGVDTNEFRPDIDSKRVLDLYGLNPGYVLCVGRLVKQKGFSRFVEALHGTSLRGIIVGDGPDYTSLTSQAKSMLQRGQLVILRSVPRENLPAIYASASIYSFTSLTEGLPAVGVEALASGLPIAAMRAPGVSELVSPGENGLLTSSDSPKELGEALERVVGNPILRDRMAVTSRSIALREYSWESVATRTLDVYHEIIER